jgi:hypothetical protein
MISKTRPRESGILLPFFHEVEGSLLLGLPVAAGFGFAGFAGVVLIGEGLPFGRLTGAGFCGFGTFGLTGEGP